MFFWRHNVDDTNNDDDNVSAATAFITECYCSLTQKLHRLKSSLKRPPVFLSFLARRSTTA